MDIAELLAFSVKNKASDLHLSAGLPPMIRVDGDVRRINIPALDHKQVHALVYDIMSDKQRRDYEEFLEVDFSFEIPSLARFRVNAFNQNRGAGAVFRTIPSEVLTLEDLACPPLFREVIQQPQGLILVTGPTGSGKSTTLAAMIDYINKNEYGHILTVEDPIEFVHTSQKCLINQREVHRDTHGFNEALRSALREDPDIILVGELRDLETIRLALAAAEAARSAMAAHDINREAAAEAAKAARGATNDAAVAREAAREAAAEARRAMQEVDNETARASRTRAMQRLASQQSELASRQATLGSQQAALGERQARVHAQASQQAQQVIARALASGKAERL